jgi:hypothetical protein
VVSNFEMSLGKILDVRGQHIIIKWLRMLIWMAFVRCLYFQKFWRNKCLNLVHTFWNTVYQVNATKHASCTMGIL